MSINQRLIKATAMAVLLLLLIASTKGQTLATDHFRSRASGKWFLANSWESSHDSIFWISANAAPDIQSSSVTIRTGHKINISNSLNIDQLKVTQGAILKDTSTFSLNLNDGSGIDLIVDGKIDLRNGIGGQGSVRIRNGGEYNVNAVASSATVKSCQWDNGSTLKISNIDALTSITGLSQDLYNFIWDGGSTQKYPINLNLTNSFHIRGNAIIMSTYGKDLVLSSSSESRAYSIEGNLEIQNKSWIVLSNGTGSVELTINGNTIVGQNVSAIARLELGKDGIVNNVLILGGNLDVNYGAGINKYTTSRNGKIKFVNTISPQIVTNNNEINYVNFEINNGVAVTANKWEVDNGYSLLLKENASFILLNSSSVPATVERSVSNADWNIPSDGWHLLSSPVENQSLSTGGFTTAPYDFYSWSEAGDQWLNQKEAANNITSFVPGKGYLASYDNGGTLTFTGTLNSAPVTFTNLSVSQTSPYAGFHLLGNPFPCSLDWNGSGWAANNISSVAQVWDEGARNYLPLTAGNGIIPPQQGFFVQATAPVNSITIPASARVHSGRPFYKDLPAGILRLRITGVADSAFDETVVRFTEGASSGPDNADGHKLAGGENSPQLYSVLQPGENMCVNSFPPDGIPATVKLYFEPGAGRLYVLEPLVNTMGNDVFLEDKKTGTVSLLRQGTGINIEASASDDVSRFVLHFGPVAIGEKVASPVHVYSYGTAVYFRDCSNKAFRITDIAGRVVACGVTGNSTLHTLDAGSLKAGVYIVTVCDPGKTMYTCKIIL